MKQFYFRSVVIALGVLPSVRGFAAEVDYNRDIRPILSENCFHCHGFDEKSRKAGLRLDVLESAFEERDGVTAIKPGDLVGSDAWQRIISKDSEEMMPPPKSHLKLSEPEKQRLKAWIEQGAKYAGHWAFIAPQRPILPEGAVGPVDAFVRERLVQEGLKAGSEADRPTLIRRLALDLTGLPPSAEEVLAFERDSSPAAYEALVERFLQSPHFGERMASEWLDAARYADTNGFSIDGGRQMWLWRDWVIQAFNDNKPYDQFLTEQLAGDLLPGRTDAQLIATGFQRNNMVTHEGGTIPEENLTNYNADRVKTLGESVLGLTLACAQCHNHKFDPITQKDYFQIFAFFNSLSDRGLDGNGGVNPGPFVSARTVLRTEEVPELEKRIAELRMTLSRPDTNVLVEWEKREQAVLRERGRELDLHPVKILKVSTPNRGGGFDPEGDNHVRLKDVGDMGVFDISAELPRLERPITGIRVVVHPVPELPGGGWGPGPKEGKSRKAEAASRVSSTAAQHPERKGSFVLTALSVTADRFANDQINLHKLERVARVTASSWEDAYPPAGCLEPRNETGWAPSLKAEGAVRLTATFASPLAVGEASHVTLQLNFGHGKSLVAEHIEILVTTGTDNDSDLNPEVISALSVPPGHRSDAQKAALWSACASSSAELDFVRVELRNLEERLGALTQPFQTMVMDVAVKPRDTFILNRGDYAQPTEKVIPGTIAALPSMAEDAPRDRLGLARWITMRSHPLTARVAVNRFWKMLFGTGIVGTPADFGSQGEWPTHPALLDWLAVEFMDSGWDVKQLIRMVVNSYTYRQSSVASPELLERDPQNRLLARGPRFRVPSETVRDIALKAGGLLVPRIGGPSVNPYMPGDLWREVSHYGSTPATAQAFVQDHGEKLYRRSLYTFWKRTAPPPNMMAFDAPNREVCTIARGNTTTPMQALVSLNDPQFVEAARALGQRMILCSDEDEKRLQWAFREVVSRPLKPTEQEVLKRALARERERFRASPALALEVLSVGESPRVGSIPPSEHAAWMQIASLLLNLSEVITHN
jgi:hypothetical protein